MIGPDKNKLYPNESIKTVCFISNLPKRFNVEIGDRKSTRLNSSHL